MSTHYSFQSVAFARFLVLLLVVGCTGTPTPTPPPTTTVCVDFEAPLVLGTQYGTPIGQAPGDLAFTTTNGVSVTVQDFTHASGTAFNEAIVETPPVPFGSGQSLRSNNINLEFDFSSIGFTARAVTVEFLDLGGSENLTVDGNPVYAGDLSGVPSTIGGVGVAVTTASVSGGLTGTLTLSGSVSRLLIGGQEFWIDNICASG
jgi:hypothetical protein